MKKFIFVILILFSLTLVGCKEDKYFTIEDENVQVYKGNLLELEFDTNYKNLNWESSDTDVAIVNGGVISAINQGFAYITVKHKNEVLAEFVVEVLKKPFKIVYHTLTIDGDPYQVREGTVLSQNIFEYFNGKYHEDYDDSYFVGWFLDSGYHSQCELSMPVNEDMSIYSKYTNLEIISDLRVYVNNIIGKDGEFKIGLDVQTFSPSYGTYVDYSNGKLEDYALVVVKYNIEEEKYYVQEVINDGKKDVIIPFDGFVIAVKKKIDERNIYLENLVVGAEVSLGKYSINTSNIIFVNEKRNAFKNDFVLDSTLNTKYVSVYDVRDSQTLFTRQGDAKAYLASTTKIITALAAVKYAKLEDKITIGDEIDITYEAPSPSTAGLIKGQVWTLRQLLYAMVLPSGNDAAYAIAALTINSKYPNNTYTAKEKVNMFIDIMNEIAIDVGATNSHFMVPDGNSYYNVDGSLGTRITNNYSTANDMVKFARYAISCGALADVFATTNISFQLESKQYINLGSTNSLIKRTTEYFCYGAIGIKTGNTAQAGYCIVSGVEINRRFVISVVLYAATSNGRYVDTLTLYRSVFGNQIYE